MRERVRERERERAGARARERMTVREEKRERSRVRESANPIYMETDKNREKGNAYMKAIIHFKLANKRNGLNRLSLRRCPGAR